MAKELSARDRTDEQIKELEKELATTKYNKRTQHHIGLVKAKLAALKEKKEKSASSGKKGEGYSVRKTGDGTVVLLGFPSVGKSTLLNALTNANSPVGAYAFTTLKVIPGVLEYNHAKIHILDVPGILKGAAAGTGRGKEVLQVLRNSELILILIDVFHPEHYDVLMQEVYDVGIRMNVKKPDIRITKTARGGINVGKTVHLDIEDDTIRAILHEFKISNANVLIRTPITEDQVIDAVRKNCVYIPAVTVLNKIDLVDEKTLNSIKSRIPIDIAISANKKGNIEELKAFIFERISLMRVYCKETGKPADLNEPLIIQTDATLENMCSKLHKDFVKKFRFARVWGKSAKFDGQKILRLDHTLKDGDVVEIHIR